MITRVADHFRRAFSLIEIMVAVTLLSVITVGLLAMFYQTQKAFRLGANQSDVYEGGRTAMELISRELQEMYPSYSSNVVNFRAAPGTTATIMMTNVFGVVRTNVLQDISFLARRGDDWLGITYRVDDRPDGTDTGLGTLYRSVVVSKHPTLRAEITVFNVISNAMVVEPDIALNTNYHRILDGVVHFRVFASDQFGYFYTNSYSPRARAGATIEVTPEGNNALEYYFYDWVPAYVDIELGILDPKAVEQHRARSGIPANAKTFLQDQGHRVHLFKRRVPIRARHSQFDILSSR